ncbi:DUF7146 domain-containing protein [Rhizobium halophilum]|uniref:DUF7146 domain-containing protein n=1 Tax=Rhizobium halophilum TaxID=2846852 RepID=UPI001EFE1609|nr:toprim domain-containing protein [Rhizobium halophilum]MCF6368320.1 toprim domain-containing protein [Rhizobium halophilum]
MSPHNDLPEIKQGLKDRVESLCQRLLPDGRRQGRLWVAHNPVTGDHRQTPEFKVALTRDIGAWKDWRTGEKGDVIKLVEYLTGSDFKGAMSWSRDFLGLRSMSPEQRRRMADRAAEARRDAEQQAQADQLKRMRQAERIWNSGLQDGAGSTAEAYARRYFAARGIPLENIPNRDLQTFRFTAEQEFWARAQYRHENGRRIKVQDGPKFPAVLSAMRVATGQVAAVHMTFLDPLGPRKLPVDAGTENAKIMFGPSAGAVIRISHGPEGEPPETARQAHPLIMGEGIETTASVAIETPEARAWAAGSLANMLHAPIDLPCVSSIILLRDHFKHKTTEKQFAAVCEAMERSGKPWTAIDSLWGNDFNDMRQEG